MKKIAGISTLLLLGFVVLVHWRVLLSTLGSFAIAAQVLFTLGMALVAYTFGFGLNQAQRRAMALAVCSRNGSAMLVAVTAFPVIDPNLMAMVLLAVPVPVVVWLALSKLPRLPCRQDQCRRCGRTSRAVSEMKRQPMNNAMKSKLNLLVAACALLASVTRAQSESVSYRPLTLAPADAAASGGGGAGDDAKAKAAELAKKLANPIGALISVPFQNNFDFGGGPDGDGFQYKVNLQPIVPITLSEDWLLISRTILPIVYQENIVGTSSQAGLADTLQSLLSLAGQADQGRLDLGRRAGLAAPNRHR